MAATPTPITTVSLLPPGGGGAPGRTGAQSHHRWAFWSGMPSLAHSHPHVT